MNSLLLFLFLGASVALAELPFDDPALAEEIFKNEEGEEFLGELQLADEENDPLPPPTRPPPVVSLFFRNNQRNNVNNINRDI